MKTIRLTERQLELITRILSRVSGNLKPCDKKTSSFGTAYYQYGNLSTENLEFTMDSSTKVEIDDLIKELYAQEEYAANPLRMEFFVYFDNISFRRELAVPAGTSRKFEDYHDSVIFPVQINEEAMAND